MPSVPLPVAARDVADPDLELTVLLRRIAARDAEALGRFYDLTLGRSYAMAMRVLRDPSEAEECVGDVYWQVWERAGDYRAERGAPLAWLHTLAWSRAVDRLRRLRRQPITLSVHPEDGEAPYMACEGLRVEDAVEHWSSARAVQSAFGRLSDVQQRVLRLAFEQDLSHQDIATATGLPLGTVKSHARRGLAQLRQALEAEEGA